MATVEDLDALLQRRALQAEVVRDWREVHDRQAEFERYVNAKRRVTEKLREIGSRRPWWGDRQDEWDTLQDQLTEVTEGQEQLRSQMSINELAEEPGKAAQDWAQHQLTDAEGALAAIDESIARHVQQLGDTWMIRVQAAPELRITSEGRRVTSYRAASGDVLLSVREAQQDLGETVTDGTVPFPSVAGTVDSATFFNRMIVLLDDIERQRNAMLLSEHGGRTTQQGWEPPRPSTTVTPHVNVANHWSQRQFALPSHWLPTDVIDHFIAVSRSTSPLLSADSAPLMQKFTSLSHLYLEIDHGQRVLEHAEYQQRPSGQVATTADGFPYFDVPSTHLNAAWRGWTSMARDCALRHGQEYELEWQKQGSWTERVDGALRGSSTMTNDLSDGGLMAAHDRSVAYSVRSAILGFREELGITDREEPFGSELSDPDADALLRNLRHTPGWNEELDALIPAAALDRAVLDVSRRSELEAVADQMTTGLGLAG